MASSSPQHGKKTAKHGRLPYLTGGARRAFFVKATKRTVGTLEELQIFLGQVGKSVHRTARKLTIKQEWQEEIPFSPGVEQQTSSGRRFTKMRPELNCLTYILSL